MTTLATRQLAADLVDHVVKTGQLTDDSFFNSNRDHLIHDHSGKVDFTPIARKIRVVERGSAISINLPNAPLVEATIKCSHGHEYISHRTHITLNELLAEVVTEALKG